MSSHTDGRFPIASALLLTIGVAVFFITGAAERLQFNRAMIESGQLWRLVTGHWTHWTVDQFFWDGATFGVLAWLCERRSRARMLTCIGLSIALISMTVWLSDVVTYRGLSGIDSALFAMLVVLMGREMSSRRELPGLAMLALLSMLFIAKTIFEMISGATVFAESSVMTPMPLAHVTGAAAGVVVGCVGSARTAGNRLSNSTKLNLNRRRFEL